MPQLLPRGQYGHQWLYNHSAFTRFADVLNLLQGQCCKIKPDSHTADLRIQSILMRETYQKHITTPLSSLRPQLRLGQRDHHGNRRPDNKLD